MRHSYLVLLVALLALLVGYPLARGESGELLYRVLLTAVFLAALAVVFRTGRSRVAGLVFGAPTVLGLWTGYALPGVAGRPLDVGFHAAAALFLGCAVGAILRGVYRGPAVTADGVYGGFCGYVLLGLVFGHVFCVLEAAAPGSFAGDGLLGPRLQTPAERRFLLTYFSLTTITTAGFGDVTPRSDAARSLAMVEAVAGQFYIAVLEAELIGKKLAPPPGQATPQA